MRKAIIEGIGKPPRKKSYQKPEAVKELEQLETADARLKHPTIPVHALAPRKFRDDTANSLTCCIVAYITMSGGWASRIGNQGTYKKSLGKYIPGTAKKGLADVIATYQGKSLHIEVKVGKDRMSEHQRLVEQDVNRTGGHYRNFTEFKAWLESIPSMKHYQINQIK